jgi:hypothetical protein
MSSIWRWIIGIIVGLLLLGLLLGVRSDRQAYRTARGAINARVETAQERIDTAIQSANAAVDTALQLAGNLPSQQAAADLIKQDIEEIGNRLKDVAEARGDAAIQKLEQASEQFDTALQDVENAANDATDPKEQATLNRIYGVLIAAQEQIQQAVLSAKQ